MKLGEATTITLSHATAGGRVITLNNTDFVFTNEKQNSKLFHRKVLKTEFRLNKGDYQYLKNIENDPLERCKKITVTIQYNPTSSSTPDTLHTGYISLLDSKFENDTCTIYAPLRVQDSYTALDEIYKQKTNILDSTSKVEINHLVSGTTLVTLEGNNTNFPPLGIPPMDEGWTLTQVEETAPIGDPENFTANTVEYSRFEKTFTTAPDSKLGWTLISGNDYFKQPRTRQLEPVTNTAGGYVVRTTNFEVIDNYKSILKADTGVLLSDALTQLLSSTSYTVKSDFFNINADGTAPINPAYLFAADYLNDPVIFKSNSLIRPVTDENAFIFNISLEQLEQQLKELAQVIFFTSESDPLTVRIEHISYLENQPLALNLKTRDGGKWIVRKNTYTYQTDNSPLSEDFIIEGSTRFSGFPFLYDVICAGKDKEEILHTPPKLTTDYLDILHNQNYPHDITVLVSKFIYDGEYHLTCLPVAEAEAYPYYLTGNLFESVEAGLPQTNGALSFYQLQKNCYLHRRPQGNATWTPIKTENILYRQTINFLSKQKNKKQVSISVAGFSHTDWLNFDLNQFVATQISDAGEILTVNYSLKNCRLDLDLLHGDNSTFCDLNYTSADDTGSYVYGQYQDGSNFNADGYNAATADELQTVIEDYLTAQGYSYSSVVITTNGEQISNVQILGTNASISIIEITYEDYKTVETTTNCLTL